MLENHIKTILLLGTLTGLVLLVGQWLGGRTGMTIAIVIVVIMNVVSYFFSDKIALRVYRAKKADEKEYKWLHDMVAEVAKKAEISKPAVYIINKSQINAFACGRDEKNAAIACTTGIIKHLNKKELEGVIAHEIAHIKNREIVITTIAATLAGIISYTAYMARWAAIFGVGGRDRDGGNIISMLLLAILTPIIAAILQLAISRSREYLADARGAHFLQDSSGLAHALEKLHHGVKKKPLKQGNKAFSSLFIVNPFHGGGLVNLFSTHPPLEVRVRKLRNMKF
jgi:heat shock protein HtpX